MKRSLPYFTFLLILFASNVRADFNDGVITYLTGDYEKSFTIMQSLAEVSDHGYAQYYLGMMYMKGQGVEQDYKKAGEWFLKASEKAIPSAHYKLGDLYFKGRGLPKDYESAYIWFSVGASHNHPLSVGAVDKAKQKLSPQELESADKLIATYIGKYGPQEGVDPAQPIRIDNE